MVYADINAASNVNEPKNEDEEEKNVWNTFWIFALNPFFRTSL